jgi:ABC-2 type transport system permease protein
MTALLSAEALKLRTTRLFWIVAAIAVGLSGLIGYAMVQISSNQGEPLSLGALAAGPAQVTWFLGIVVALVASAGEFQHRTIRTTLLATPRRTDVLLAKSIVAATYGAVLVVLGGLSAIAGGVLASAFVDVPLDTNGGPSSWQVIGTVALGALWAILATGIGLLTRSVALAIAVVLLWRFVGEGVLPVVTGIDGISRWTPTGLATSIVGVDASSTAPLVAGLGLAGYAIVICGIAAIAFLRSDPT